MKFTGLALVALCGAVLAHPGHDVSQEINERATFKALSARSDLSHCASKLRARGMDKRNHLRRSAMVHSLKRRTLSSDLDTDHNKTLAGISLKTPESVLFSGSKSCLLTPEVTDGPYYVTGEFVRRNVAEEQTGVPITLDYQVIDVDTCAPVPDVYLEIWHCNATGVYSGVSSPQGGLDTTWLRGIQRTDKDGVAQFDSIFPGHYTGRATHIHVLVHHNASLLSNMTLGQDNTATHVGQTFFDQGLISAVERTSPYTSNEQTLTENVDDDILASEAATDGVDPLMDYTLLGNDISEGIFAWLSFGVNMTYSSQAGAAANYYATGGVENSSGPSASGPSGHDTSKA